jgi:hypothetical protein
MPPCIGATMKAVAETENAATRAAFFMMAGMMLRGDDRLERLYRHPTSKPLSPQYLDTQSLNRLHDFEGRIATIHFEML